MRGWLSQHFFTASCDSSHSFLLPQPISWSFRRYFHPRFSFPGGKEDNVMIHAESKTVADMVAENPARAAVFEKHGIDFCCQGQRPFGEVCKEQGLSPDTLWDETQCKSASRRRTGLERRVPRGPRGAHCRSSPRLPSLGLSIPRRKAGETYPGPHRHARRHAAPSGQTDPRARSRTHRSHPHR